MSTDVVVREPVVRSELSVQDLVDRADKIRKAMQGAMKDGEHYGIIPGTDKPTLLKPGAEKLCQLFLFDPEYQDEQKWDGEHLTVTARCTLYHIPTGNRVAAGMAMCSTKESKYAYRNAKRVCPNCGAEEIIKGKAEYGGGWLCWKKKGGCGQKFPEGDPAIESQEAGQKPNENLPDTYNTVMKMACKRALIAAVLNGTAASDVFTQDLDDTDESGSDTLTRDDGAVRQSDPEHSQAVTELDEAFKYTLENGSLPPGQTDWATYLQEEIKARYKIIPERWRTDLTAEQIRELAGWLREQDIGF